MKILVCMPHFFPVSHRKHAIQGSSQATVEQRAHTFDYCLKQINSLLSSKYILLGTKNPNLGAVINTDVEAVKNNISGDIFICTFQDNHILTEIKSKPYVHVQSSSSHPMLLGYTCRRIFARFKDKYDLFFYTEDDIAPLDPEFFLKIIKFYDSFDSQKVILPQRYELFESTGIKCYTDNPTPNVYQVDPDFVVEKQLIFNSFSRSIKLEWTKNHGSGCYAITREQLEIWMSMETFLHPSNINPMDALEQAMLPIDGHFPLYKPSVDNISFLEVHHVPNRLCHATTPASKISQLLGS